MTRLPIQSVNAVIEIGHAHNDDERRAERIS